MHYDLLHFATGRACLETLDMGVGQHLDARMLEGGLHAHHLSICLGIDQAREPVAGAAPDARTRVPILLIEHDAKRDVERGVPGTAEVLE